MSRCSTSAARSPRLVASSSAPAPTMPPPTIRTSKRSSASARSASRRQAGSVALGAAGALPLVSVTLASTSSHVPIASRQDFESGLGRATRRDPPQDESGPDHEDQDGERGVEDDPLGVSGQRGGENRRSQHDAHRD